MILPTNHVKDIEDAIQSTISVALRLDTRKTLWESFLKNAATAKGLTEYTAVGLDWQSEKEVNRQVVCY